MSMSMREPRIAVLVPCRDEAQTIGQVVAGFRAALPPARVHVFDNNSADDTIASAEAAGAEVERVAQQGKGHVVRRMFANVEADIYLLVDGDGTYDAASASRVPASSSSRSSVPSASTRSPTSATRS